MSSKKILITGIAGLLGANFSRYMLARGYEVVGIDDLSGGYAENIPDGVRWIKIDLANLNAVDTFLHYEKPDYVYHFAAYAAEGLSPFIRMFNYTNNTIASANVITCCIKHDVKKLIFTSSMAVYGDENIPPFVETMQQKPIDPYGIAKYAMEMDLKVAAAQHGLAYTIIRPHNIIGKYQNIWDRYRNVIGIFIRNSINNEPLLIYGDGEQKRAFSDVDYYMKPFEQVLEPKFNNEIFNLGGDKEYTLNQAVKIVQKVACEFGPPPQVQYVEGRHEAKFAFSDHTKAKKLLNFKDNTNVEELVRKMFQWALTQPKRKIFDMTYELEKGIYSFWK